LDVPSDHGSWIRDAFKLTTMGVRRFTHPAKVEKTVQLACAALLRTSPQP
jgi:hypothetical protein